MSNGWVVPLTIVAATGDAKQLYPDYCTAGAGAMTQGELVRKPLGGILKNAQIEPDDINGGIIQLYDMDAGLEGADVDTLDAVTNAQIVAALAAGRARLIWEQVFSGDSSARLAVAQGLPFARGLVARAVSTAPAGSCKIVLVVSGGCVKTERHV